MPYYMYVSLQDDDKIVLFTMDAGTGKLTQRRGACRRWAVSTDDEPGPQGSLRWASQCSRDIQLSD